MNGKQAFIWDLDGTLLDTYGLIVSSLCTVCREFGLGADPEAIRRQVLISSVGDFVEEAEKKAGIPAAALWDRYSRLNEGRAAEIRPIEHAAETLARLRELGCVNLVYTHRGASAHGLLESTGLLPFFSEIVTAEAGFPRKPDPAALLYLIKKHGLSKENCFYVGDRSLDILCAANAGVHGILYLPPESPVKPTGKETFIVKELSDITRIAERPKAVFKRFEPADYQAVCDFLIDLNEPDRRRINWNWARFEWMYEHPQFDKSSLSSIGLWMSGERVVGASIYDMYFGEAFAGALPEYRDLLPEILDRAFADLSDGEGLAAAFCDEDDYGIGQALAAGFERTEQTETIMELKLGGAFPVRLPDGLSFGTLDPVTDADKLGWLFWQGFDHGTDRAEYERSEQPVPAVRKHFKSELSAAVFNESGEAVACCCVWFDERTDYAYVEPVCTVPAYRNMGAARAVIFEALNRAHALGAGSAYVISDMEFYKKLGFEPKYHYTFYKKEKRTMLTLQRARELNDSQVTEHHLIIHAKNVMYAMGAMADRFGEDREHWMAIGYLHDYDYEKYPDEHLKHTEKELLAEGVDPADVRAILSHGWGGCTDVEPLSNMEKSLYTVDELTGIIQACARMRPQGIRDLEVRSFIKKFKDKKFAAKCDRALILKGCEMLGMELAEVAAVCIEGMKPYAEDIELLGTEGGI